MDIYHQKGDETIEVVNLLLMYTGRLTQFTLINGNTLEELGSYHHIKELPYDYNHYLVEKFIVLGAAGESPEMVMKVHVP